MKKKRLRKSEIRVLNEQISRYGYEVHKKDDVEILDDEVIVINGEVLFFYHDKNIVPTLKLLLKGASMKIIVVDMGAVKFMASGADVMRPGIVEIDNEIEVGDFVVVVDENNRKPLAVCIAMFGTDEMRAMDSGKVLKNIHYVGDEIWNFG